MPRRCSYAWRGGHEFTPDQLSLIERCKAVSMMYAFAMQIKDVWQPLAMNQEERAALRLDTEIVRACELLLISFGTSTANHGCPRPLHQNYREISKAYQNYARCSEYPEDHSCVGEDCVSCANRRRRLQVLRDFVFAEGLKHLREHYGGRLQVTRTGEQSEFWLAHRALFYLAVACLSTCATSLTVSMYNPRKLWNEIDGLVRTLGSECSKHVELPELANRYIKSTNSELLLTVCHCTDESTPLFACDRCKNRESTRRLREQVGELGRREVREVVGSWYTIGHRGDRVAESEQRAAG